MTLVTLLGVILLNSKVMLFKLLIISKTLVENQFGTKIKQIYPNFVSKLDNTICGINKSSVLGLIG